MEAARKLGKRMYGLHLKDVNEQNRDVVFGDGRLRFEELFLTMKQKDALDSCAVILEYELEPDDPIPGIRKSVERIRSILKKVTS